MNSKYMREGRADSQASSGSHDPVLIQRALDEILLSPPFRSTKQCQDLLRYVVDNTLAGLDHLLRERVIGAEVFGRKPDYDTGEDPVVRLRASEVRKRLAQYYQGTNGEKLVRIEIPSGSYRATFDWPVEQEQMPAPLVLTDAHETQSTSLTVRLDGALAGREDKPSGSARRAKPWVWIALAACLVLITAGIFERQSMTSQDRPFRQFWAPIVGDPKTVIICMGSNAVYRLSNRYLNEYLSENHLEAHDGFDFFAFLPPEKMIEARNLEKAYNSFVALGDVAAVSDIVADLTRQGKQFEQRFPPDISFAELQKTPTITVGGFNNPLTMTLTKDLRFVLKEGSRIEDSTDKTRVWSTSFNGDSHDTEDYAVVTRLIDAKTGGPVLSIAGIGQYGTRAAAEFISSPEAIAALVKTAPAGWSSHNLQIVLHIHIVNFRPIRTDVVASHYW